MLAGVFSISCTLPVVYFRENKRRERQSYTVVPDLVHDMDPSCPYLNSSGHSNDCCRGTGRNGVANLQCWTFAHWSFCKFMLEKSEFSVGTHARVETMYKGHSESSDNVISC